MPGNRLNPGCGCCDACDVPNSCDPGTQTMNRVVVDITSANTGTVVTYSPLVTNFWARLAFANLGSYVNGSYEVLRDPVTCEWETLEIYIPIDDTIEVDVYGSGCSGGFFSGPHELTDTGVSISVSAQDIIDSGERKTLFIFTATFSGILSIFGGDFSCSVEMFVEPADFADMMRCNDTMDIEERVYTGDIWSCNSFNPSSVSVVGTAENFDA